MKNVNTPGLPRDYEPQEILDAAAVREANRRHTAQVALETKQDHSTFSDEKDAGQGEE